METTITMLDVALEYLGRGWSVIPLQGKMPRVLWQEFKEKRPTEELVRRWWTQWPDAGIGVALGKVSNLVRIDADGAEAAEELERRGGCGETLEFMTPAGGRGWLLQYLDGLATEVLWTGEGHHQELRVQSDGAYTVLPPSQHPAGGNYAWMDEGSEPANLPQWLYDRHVKRVLQNLTKEIRPTLREPDKDDVLAALKHIDFDDYDTWIKVGMALKASGYDIEVWEEWSRDSDKFKESECQRKWASFHSLPGGLTARSIIWLAEQNGYKPPNRHEPITDLGNARMLARLFGDKFKHSEFWGWLAWDGCRWRKEGAEKQVQEAQKQVLAIRTTAAIKSYAEHLAGDPKAEGYAERRKSKLKTIGMIRAHEDDGRIRGARRLASSEPCIDVDYRLFDKKPMLFNCPNGTLDLQRCELRPHDREDMLTQLCPTGYDPQATCPMWEKYLEEILPDASVRDFLWRFLGCCLTGDTSPQIMPVFWGCGSNGKSTLVETVMHVMGEDYSMKAKRDLLTAKRYNEHPTSIARLYGKRFVACVETAERARLDEALVKETTGGDTIAARKMREDEWQFTPTHKPVLATNHKPEIWGTDDGIWRRIPLVPFTQQFPEDDPRRIPDLKEKLKEEGPGILRWMVEGCRRWLASGKKLSLPEPVKEASKSYRDEEDWFKQFLEERCIRGEGKSVRVEKLVAALFAWAAGDKLRQLVGPKLTAKMKEQGIEKRKGGQYFEGVELVEG